MSAHRQEAKRVCGTAAARRPRAVPLLVLLAALAAGCGARGHAQAPPSQQVTLTVLVYSGRENPSLALDDAAIQQLKALLAAAVPRERFPRATVLPGVLGYNGVVVQNPAGRGGLPAQILVYGSAVEVRNGATRFLDDPPAAIEAFLLQQALQQRIIDERTLSVARGKVR